MAFLNPILDKFKVDFSANLFPKEMTERYDRYLKAKNSPLKRIEDIISESIVSVSVPGFEIPTNTITGMSNLGGDPYKGDFPTVVTQLTLPSDVSKMETFSSQTITLTLQNNLLNWLYFYEVYNGYFKNERTIDMFEIYITMKDAAEIDVMRFVFGGCFCSGMAGLEFATNEEYMQAKTVDVNFVFNSMDVDTILPEFNMKTVNLK